MKKTLILLSLLSLGSITAEEASVIKGLEKENLITEISNQVNEITKKFSLKDLEKKVLSQNLIIQSADETVAANKYSTANLSAFTLPQISASSSWLNSNKSYNIMGNDKEQYSAEVQITQFLYGFGARSAAKNYAQNLHSLSTIRKTITKKNILLNLRMQYENLQFLRAKLELEQKQKYQRNAEQKDIEALFKAGIVTIRDVRMQKIKVNEIENNLIRTSSEIEKQLLTIGAILNIKKEEFEISNVIESLGIKESNENSEINLYKTSLASEKANESVIKKARLPQINAYGSYTYSGYDINEMDDTTQFGVTISWNLFDGNKTAREISESMHKQKAAELNLENQKNEIEKQKEQIKIDLESIDIQIKLQAKTLEYAKENYIDARSEYKAGRITLTQLNEIALFKDSSEFLLITHKSTKRINIHSYNSLCE